MSLQKLEKTIALNLEDLYSSGRAKGKEKVVVNVKKAFGTHGPRYFLEGFGDKEFIKMNANSYLGLSLRDDMVQAEEEAARKFGVGPGAVRFISGTYNMHIQLEKKLAEFHGKEAGMIFSSAYVTSMGVIYPLTTAETVLISDELNHNCIINGVRLTRPAHKTIYKHNNMADLEKQLEEAVGKGRRCLVITDGIFSMRGDHAPLHEIVEICQKFDEKFEEGVITVVDDSHGVGSFGETGRGTEEYTRAKADVLIGTLGKAFGVNGGYLVSSARIIEFLRETAPMYIYSNPITVSECNAAMKALDILTSEEGKTIIGHLHKMTKKFESGLLDLGFETIKGDHPVVPLMVRDTQETRKIVDFLLEHGVLATGLNFPVVPKGDEEIRFQVSAEHTEQDIDQVLSLLKKYKEQ
ncbi:MAG: aminotransferase class I/II-fold pyridoxal phosphate-dependent enzyme [Candidatus Marinimicrobia bacterium]|nr:aminotransferase class I/II-fold pyridoxal phosphate-dependent enzyme [Candidatus Neomarinimicrobiota bacterium]